MDMKECIYYELTDYSNTLVQPALHGLIEKLKESGQLTSPAIIEAFVSTPRHHFIQRYYLKEGHVLKWQLKEAPPLDSPEVGSWLAAIYADEALVTRIDQQSYPTSSSSQPGVMALMLEALDVQRGQRVLEIGTGTGYNAALLARLTGSPSLVTTVEIDAELARQVQQALDCVVEPGVTVENGNGLRGYPAHAPYKRIIATTSYSHIPTTWLEQLAPGGVLVMNLRGELAGGIVRLEKSTDGRTATGRFLAAGDIRFMSLRDPETRGQPVPLDVGAYEKLERVEDLTFPESTFDPQFYKSDFMFFLQWGFPRAHLKWRHNGRGSREKADLQNYLPYLVDATSQTIVRFSPGEQPGEWVAEGRGAQQLASRFVKAYQRWQGLGRPVPSDYRIVIKANGEQEVTIALNAASREDAPRWQIHK
jgi:protein-L-isoaspartate(D-aspartate) O-methyltransferase